MTAKIIDFRTRCEITVEKIKEEEEYQKFIQSYLSTLSPDERRSFHAMEKWAQDLHEKRESQTTAYDRIRRQKLADERKRIIAEMNNILDQMK